MQEFIAISATEIHDDVAIRTRSTPGPDGGLVPGRCAGYTHDGAAYCPECAGDVTAETPDGEEVPLTHFPADATDPNGFGVGVVAGWDEWDYPGATCDVCLKALDTHVLVHAEGLGADVYAEEMG